MNTMHVDDFVVLGRTVPEDSKKYGNRICMAGYSAENNQFLRIYPLMLPVGVNADANSFKARHRYSLELRRNEHDNRTESWRVKDERNPTSTPWDKPFEVKKPEILKWLDSRAVKSIQSLNECRLSLGALSVKASQWQGCMIPRNNSEIDEAERTLFQDLEGEEGLDPNAIKYVPYIRFTDAVGDHRLQVREWGAYRLLVQPQYADQPESLWSAPGYREGKDLFFILGNMCNHRNNWLIIKTFEIDSGDGSPTLFDAVD